MKVSKFAVKILLEKQILLENHVCKKIQEPPLENACKVAFLLLLGGCQCLRRNREIKERSKRLGILSFLAGNDPPYSIHLKVCTNSIGPVSCLSKRHPPAMIVLRHWMEPQLCLIGITFPGIRHFCENDLEKVRNVIETENYTYILL